MATEKQILAYEITLEAAKAEGSVGKFKKELKDANNELQYMAERFGETSIEAQIAAKKVATLKDAIGDAKAVADSFSPDKKFVALGGALQGAVAGFSSLQGVMGLFGAESKDVEKMILKVQSAMALQQGISGVIGAMDSFKLLGAEVVKSNLFLTINNSVTAISSGLMKLFGISVDTTSMSFKLLKGAIAATGIGLLIIAVGELVSKFQEWSQAAENAAKKQKDFDAAQVQSSKDAVASVTHRLLLEKNLAVSKATTEEQKFKIEQDFKRKSIILLQQHYEKTKGLNDKESESAIGTIQDINNAGQVAAENEKQRVIKDNKEKAKESARLEKEKKEKQQAATDKYFEDARKQGAKDLEIAAAKTKDQDEQIKKDELLAASKVTISSNAAFAVRDATKMSVEQTNELNKKYNDIDLADAKILQDAKVKATVDTLNIVGDILGKESAAGKAIAISSALINTYLGISAGVKLGYPAAIPAVLAAAATGFKAVKNIIGTKLPKGGGGGGSVPSMGSMEAPIKPQTQTTTLSTASINQIGVASSRAFVLETDVTNNQERIQRLNRAARIN
jgi:hypothetical protein